MKESDKNEYAISSCWEFKCRTNSLGLFHARSVSFRTQTPEISWQSIAWVQALLPNLCPMCSPVWEIPVESQYVKLGFCYSFVNSFCVFDWMFHSEPLWIFKGKHTSFKLNSTWFLSRCSFVVSRLSLRKLILYLSWNQSSPTREKRINTIKKVSDGNLSVCNGMWFARGTQPPKL